MLSKVDLPQPLGPITATISRGATITLMSRTASTTLSRLWKLFDMWRSSIMAECAAPSRRKADNDAHLLPSRPLAGRVERRREATGGGGGGLRLLPAWRGVGARDEPRPPAASRAH